MPPQEKFQPESFIPTGRDPAKLNAKQWLNNKVIDDGIGKNLWRIHDDLYDLSEFKHPGGDQWIRLTKGTDITEAFEVAHVFKGIFF